MQARIKARLGMFARCCYTQTPFLAHLSLNTTYVEAPLTGVLGVSGMLTRADIRMVGRTIVLLRPSPTTVT